METKTYPKRITPAQLRRYMKVWRDYVVAKGWTNCPRESLDDARHGMRKRVLGVEIPAREMSQKQYDKMLQEMWAVTDPESVNKQVRQIGMSRKRAEWTINHFPADFPDGAEAGQAYVQTILDERFGGRDLMRLSDDEASKLAMTLNMRRRGLAKRTQSACAPDAAPVHTA